MCATWRALYQWTRGSGNNVPRDIRVIFGLGSFCLCDITRNAPLDITLGHGIFLCSPGSGCSVSGSCRWYGEDVRVRADRLPSTILSMVIGSLGLRGKESGFPGK